MTTKYSYAKMITDSIALLLIFLAVVDIVSPTLHEELNRPFLLLALIPGYLLCINTKLGFFTPAFIRKIVIRVTLFLSSANSVPNDASSSPIIAFVHSSYLGFVWNDEKISEITVNGNVWVQYYLKNNTLIISGLKPATIYNIQILSATNYNFSACTNTNEPHWQPRIVDKQTVYSEALEIASTKLTLFKSRIRKLRKEFLKKKATMKQEIEFLNSKISSKKKSDERLSKRISVLEEKIKRQSKELETLTSLDSSDGVSDIRELKSYSTMRKTSSKQLDLTISSYKTQFETEALNLSKEIEACKQELNNSKQESSRMSSVNSLLVKEYISELKSRRLEKKTYRMKLENDYKTAIQSSTQISPNSSF